MQTSIKRNEILEEVYRRIPEFPSYEVSNLGNICNVVTGRLMRTSLNNYGHVKISLVSQYTGTRRTMSVARLVAEAFVRPPRFLCDQVMILDGDFTNLVATNLTWRPEWFVWRYTHQLKTPQPIYYKNLEIVNVVTGDLFDNVIHAGMTLGLIFDDIWKSTYTRESLYPLGFSFQVIE